MILIIIFLLTGTCRLAFMVASNSSNILTDAIADEDDDANAAELIATAEELELDDEEDTAGSGSSSAISLHSISVGEIDIQSFLSEFQLFF